MVVHCLVMLTNALTNANSTLLLSITHTPSVRQSSDLNEMLLRLSSSLSSF